MTTTGVATVTKPVGTVKTGETVAPLGTVTEAGGMAVAASEEEMVTKAPAGGAGPSSVTLAPVIGLPPETGAVERTSEYSAVGLTLTVTDLETPP